MKRGVRIGFENCSLCTHDQRNLFKIFTKLESYIFSIILPELVKSQIYSEYLVTQYTAEEEHRQVLRKRFVKWKENPDN